MIDIDNMNLKQIIIIILIIHIEKELLKARKGLQDNQLGLLLYNSNNKNIWSCTQYKTTRKSIIGRP